MNTLKKKINQPNVYQSFMDFSIHQQKPALLLTKTKKMGTGSFLGHISENILVLQYLIFLKKRFIPNNCSQL